jgi:hypothetical protein
MAKKKLIKKLEGGEYEALEALWLTPQGAVVLAGDEEAATLLVGEGGTISQEVAEQHGLVGRKRS